MIENRGRYLKYTLVLVPTIIVLVGGWQFRWVAEDAYIDFRVVHNILSGYGPVFNHGERVEVYTDPLWVAILTFFSGVVRIVSVEWWSVLLGLFFTGAGFWFAGLGTYNFAERRTSKPVYPVGLLCVSCVAGVWMFATSGLETGLIFGWIGVSWWLLVRSMSGSPQAVYQTAVVVSLGFTIRPDMALLCASFGYVLLVLQFKRAHDQHIRPRFVLLVLALTALPLFSELFRIAYFGLFVSNTALAKSASRIWLGQGVTYFTNFTGTYWLWIPFSILVVVTAARVRVWWVEHHRFEILVLMAPVVGGLLDVLYVTAIGGDFMHARMLLPGFFAIFMIFWFEGYPSLRNASLVTGITVWALLSVMFFRFLPLGNISNNGIANERSVYADGAKVSHPITPTDFAKDGWEIAGEQTGASAPSVSSGRKLMNWNRSATYAIVPQVPVNYPVTTSLPETYYVGFPNIGLFGLAAGDNTYVFDELSLANPIGSHFIVQVRTRPGHEKVVGPLWLDARFGSPSTPLPQGVSFFELAEAREALSCQPLAGYLHSITDHWSISQAFSNFVHTFTWTTMQYSDSPFVAEQELCH